MSFEPPYDSVVRMPLDVFDRWRVPWRGKLNFRNGFLFGTLPDIAACDDVCLPKYKEALSRFKKTGKQEDLQFPRCDRCISVGTAVAVCSPLPGRGGKDKNTCSRYRTGDHLIRDWLKKGRKEDRKRRRKARAVVV